MGKPAARIGDTTSHGGAIVAGAPTVLIGGVPAARQGDMHTCPQVNPGVPPPPHVGGPGPLGCPTVLICGQMALRVGDIVTCSGPPDSVAAGCPTVMIGEGGGAGGGAGPAGAAASAALAGGEPDSYEDHFLHVKFVDKKGNPIRGVNYSLKTPDGKEIRNTLGGQIKKTGIKEGNYEIQLTGIASAEWSVSQAKVGDKVELTAGSFGIESGTKAIISIFMKDSNSPDKLMKILDAQVQNDKIEAEWIFEVDEKYLDMQDDKKKRGGYSTPEYFFAVSAANCSARSPILRFQDWMELKLENEEGKPAAGLGYKMYFPNGEIRKGKLDSSGYAKEEKIPPGKAEIEIDDEKEDK